MSAPEMKLVASYIITAALLTGLSGCSRSSGSSGGADEPLPMPAASASGHATTPAPSASASAAPVTATVHWAGTYTSAPSSFYVYDGGEWKGFHFRGDDAAVALGDGPLSLVVDTKTNLVRGEGSGPLGDMVLTGAVTGGEVTFTVLRKDPKDLGLTGTGTAKVDGNTLTGTMHLSRGDAHVIREAKFSLSK